MYCLTIALVLFIYLLIKNRKLTDEHKRKVGEKSKGRLHSIEWKESMSQKMKGRDITWGDKISQNTRKLNDDQVIEIRDRKQAGELAKDLAVEYGVHRDTIKHVIHGHKPYFKKIE